MKRIFLGMLLICAAVNAKASSMNRDCKNNVDGILEQHGLLEGAVLVEKTKINAHGEHDLGTRYWFEVPQCEKGKVVVQVNTACGVQSIFAKYPCYVEGLRTWW